MALGEILTCSTRPTAVTVAAAAIDMLKSRLVLLEDAQLVRPEVVDASELELDRVPAGPRLRHDALERVERQRYAVADGNLPALRQRRDVVVVGVLIAPGEGRGAEANDLKTRTRVSASRRVFARRLFTLV